MNRRELLRAIGCGFGTLGAANALRGALVGNPLAPKPPHFPGKAKNVIFLFLTGGVSHVDTFDHKPMLAKYDGQAMPTPNLKTDRATGNILRSPWGFKKYGQSGIEVSDLFPKVGATIDDICVIRSMHTENGNHPGGQLMMNCGHTQLGRPSMGSWLTYGLGTENQNLPGFIVLSPGSPGYGAELWSSAFLPSVYQGTYVPTVEKRPEKMIQNIRNQQFSRAEQERQLSLLDRINRSYMDRLGDQPEFEAAIKSMEVAFRMQTEAPEVFDISRESESTRARYGDGDFGRGCLMALRMIERGVRMVQVYFASGQPWDNHTDIRLHAKLARQADGPIAALIEDLKSRGLLKETLVIIGSEFGRTPTVEASGVITFQNGRDHNRWGFTTLLAGGGVKGGITYGATDDFGFKAVEKPVHVHDLHATILHLLGLDHTRLTYRYSGRDFRLTDVGGNVVKEILA